MGRFKGNSFKELFKSNSKTRYHLYKSGKRWLVAGLSIMAGVIGGGAIGTSTVKADTNPGASKEVGQQQVLATKETDTIPATSTAQSNSAVSASTSASMSASASASTSAVESASTSGSLSASASASAQTSASMSASVSTSASASASGDIDATGTAVNLTVAQPRVMLARAQADVASTGVVSTAASTATSTASAASAGTSASATAESTASAVALAAAAATDPYANINLSDASVKAGITNAVTDLNTMNGTGNISLKILLVTINLPVGANLTYVSDILTAYTASKGTMLTSDGKPAWTAEAGLAEEFRGTAAANKMASGTSLPPSTTQNYWSNGILGHSKGWYTKDGSWITDTQYDSVNFWEGYAYTVRQYAIELNGWLAQLSNGMKDPAMQTALMNHSSYRTSDLGAGSGYLSTLGNSFMSYLTNLLTGGLYSDSTLGSVFGFKQTATATTSDVAKAASTTVTGLDRLIDIVMGVIQNSIVKQALSDIRSVGNNTDANTYAPQTLLQAINNNASLADLATSVGLTEIASSDFASQAYQAIANGIVAATVRNFKYGMTTALNTLFVQAANPTATDAAADKVYGTTDYAKLKGYSATDPTSAPNNDQSITNANAIMAQASGYAWIMKIGKPLLSMAALDAAQGKVKTDVKSIADALVSGGSISQSQYDSLMTNAANASVYNYIRTDGNGTDGSKGARNFLLQLYTAEANAVTNAKADYNADPGTTATLTANKGKNTFVNPGDPNTANPTVYTLTDYSNVYSYLQSYNAAYRAMALADSTAHAANAKGAANAGKLATTYSGSIPALSTNVTTLIGTLATTDGQAALAAKDLATSVFNAQYAAEIARLNAAYQAGVKAAKAQTVDPSSGIITSMTSLTDVSFTDANPDGGTYTYKTTDDNTAAKYTTLNIKDTDITSTAKGEAFTDGLKSAVVALTLHAASADSTFTAPADTVVYAPKGGKVTISAPVISGWYASPAVVSQTYGADSTITFYYIKGKAVTAKTASAVDVPFTGEKASALLKNPVVRITWADDTFVDVSLTNADQFTVVKDGTAIGKYTFTVTEAGAKAILAVLQANSHLTTGYELPAVADLTGITGTFAITNNPALQPHIESQNVTYYVDNTQMPTTANFVKSVSDALGKPVDASAVTSNLTSVDTSKDGTYPIKLSYTDAISGITITATAYLTVVTSTTSASAQSESAASLESANSAESAVSASAASTESANSTQSAASLESANSTQSAASLESANSTESAASLESANSTRSAASLESANSTESAASLESANSTQSAASLESANSAQSAASLESANSTESAASLESANSTESAASLESANSTESVASLESANSTESAASLESAISTESAASLESANSTESATSLESANSTESAASLQSANSTESAASLESANSAQSGASLESANSTESAASLESANSTESASSLESANSTESAASLESANSTESATSLESANSTQSAASLESANSTESAASLESANST